MGNAVLYCRVSTAEQAEEGVSLDAQAERLRAYCQLAGLHVVELVREEGVSAGKPLADRPGGARVLQLVKAGAVEHIVSLKLDRLFRDAIDALERTRAWDKAGVSLHLVDMGGSALNTGSAMGRFFLATMASFAELERNLIAERTSAALQHMKRGRRIYTSSVFGFDRNCTRLLPNDGELAAVERMRRLRAEGRTLREIAASLNEAGVPTKRAGAAWYASTVRSVLKTHEGF